MNWLEIKSESDLDEVLASEGKVALFKHSTRCPISSMAKSRIESGWDKELSSVPIYYLDLIKYRDISNYIADELNVRHQSPQLILIEGGKSIYNASHSAIRVSDVATHI